MFSHKEMIYMVYQEKSFSKAAQKLFISQPSLSAIVKKTEEKIGMPLFDRSAKPITLTEAGTAYIKAVEQIDHLEQNFEDYILALNNMETGTLSIGCNQLLSRWVLPKYVKNFMEKHPHIQVTMVDANSTTLKERVLNGQLDLVIDNVTPDPKLFERKKLQKEHLILAVPTVMGIKGGLTYKDVRNGKHIEAERVNLNLFKDIPFILLTKENDTRIRTEELFGKFKPKVIMELDRMDVIYTYVWLGTAASVVSDTLINNAVPYRDVRFFPIERKNSGREIYVSYKKNKFKTKAMDAFIKEIEDFM